MQGPSLRQLEYVVALADTGQFVEAARRCGVSQPAMSKQIRDVEDFLGVVLFERARPRVLPTEAGAEVVRRARRLLIEAQDLFALAGVFAAGQRGTVKLGVIPTIAPYGLPGLLAKLRVRYPEVSFVIEELQTPDLLEALRAGTVELALLARAFEDEGLAGPDLVEEPFVLVAPQDDPLGVAEAIDAAGVAGVSLLLMEDGHCLRDQAMEVCAMAGAPALASVTAGSVSTLVRMVESGLGATLVPTSALVTELRAGAGLVARGFRGHPPGRTLTLQWRATSPNADWFGEIGEVLRDHYLSLNAGVPAVSGPRPQIRAVGRPGR